MSNAAALNPSLFPEELLAQITDESRTLPEGLLQELLHFQKMFEKHNGLIAGGACADLLGVSKQRWYQIKKEFTFNSYKLQGVEWFGRDELEDFYKRNRKSGQTKGRTVKVLKSLMKEANK